MDSLICITCSLENNENTFCSALRHKRYLTLPYVYHRIKIHSALELSRTALLGCPLTMECFHMTSRRPCWCPKTMKRRPCWCPKPIPWELYSFLMKTLSFVPINLHRCWSREWKHSIERVSFTFTSKGKREFVPRDQVSPSLAVLCPLFSSFTQFFIHKIGLSCFYLFIFYFEKFSTWIWHLPFAVYVRLKRQSP